MFLMSHNRDSSCMAERKSLQICFTSLQGMKDEEKQGISELAILVSEGVSGSVQSENSTGHVFTVKSSDLRNGRCQDFGLFSPFFYSVYLYSTVGDSCVLIVSFRGIKDSSVVCSFFMQIPTFPFMSSGWSLQEREAVIGWIEYFR